MSMEVINKRREEGPALYSATQDVKGHPSLAILGLAADRLEELIQNTTQEDRLMIESEKGRNGRDDMATEKKVRSNSASGKDKVTFTRQSVFEAAGEMFKLQSKNNLSLDNELNNQLKIMEAQLKAMQAIEKFWQKFGAAWKDFENNPSNYQTFLKVMHLLEKEYENDPDMIKKLKGLEKRGNAAYKNEKDWQGHGWLWKLFNGVLSDPDYFKHFSHQTHSGLRDIAKETVGNPSLFENALVEGQQAFRNKIRQLFETVQILMDIVKILEGGQGNAQTALFNMEALLMDLEQLQINTNTQKSEQQQIISQGTRKNLEHNLSKIQQELKKLSARHSGGFFEGLLGIVPLLKDAVLALAEVIGAGLMAMIHQSGAAKDLMESAKKLGEKMLANPALKTLGDIAMVAIILVSALSGQYWLAAIMVGLFLMSESGWMQKLTTKIADKIEEWMGGKNEALAKVLADIIVIVMVTVISAGAGAADAALSTGANAALEAGEETGIEMTTFASNVSEQEAEIASQVDGASQEGAGIGKQSSKAAQIAKKSASMGAYGLGSILGSNTLALDILKATNKRDSEALAVILEIIQQVIAAVTIMIGGFATITQSIPKTLQGTSKTAVDLSNFASRLALGSVSLEAVAGAANGGETIIQGSVIEKLKKYEANVSLDETTQNVTDAMIKQTGEELKQLIKGYEELIATAFKTSEEVANAELQALIQG